MRYLLMPVENGFFSKNFLVLFGIVIRKHVVDNDSPRRPIFLYLQVIIDSLSSLFVGGLSFIHMKSWCRLLTVFLCPSWISDVLWVLCSQGLLSSLGVPNIYTIHLWFLELVWIFISSFLQRKCWTTLSLGFLYLWENCSVFTSV